MVSWQVRWSQTVRMVSIYALEGVKAVEEGDGKGV